MSTDTAPTLLCFELVHALVSPLSITVGEYLMVIFPCAHLFSFTGDSHCSDSPLLYTATHSFLLCPSQPVSASDNISLCAHLFSSICKSTNTALTPVLCCALLFIQIQFVSSSCMYVLFQCSRVHVCQKVPCACVALPKQIILTISFVSLLLLCCYFNRSS